MLQDACGMIDLAGVAEKLGLALTAEQIESFTKNHSQSETAKRFELLAHWMAQVNSQNHDGVMLTPVITNHLAGNSDFGVLLNNLNSLNEETRQGRFNVDNRLQKELEYKRYVSEANRQRDWPKEPSEQRREFDELPMLPVSRDGGEFELLMEDRFEAKRAAYEAKLFLTFLQEFRSGTDRHIVVVGNERYGRHWVVEPLEGYLADFELRYDRVPSHSSMRMTVPHYLERFQRSGFPPEFIKRLSAEMPHVVVVDECSPRRTEHYTKLARGGRDLVNWFMVFNDLRAKGSIEQYVADSTLHVQHLSELKKWYEFALVRRRIREWVCPGPIYKISHWAPELKSQVLMGDMIVPSSPPDLSDGKPQVVLANPAIYRSDGDDLPSLLKGTHPYYFNDPEKNVREEIVPGFGSHGFETRIEGFTTDEYVAAVQKQIRLELVLMLG